MWQKDTNLTNPTVLKNIGKAYFGSKMPAVSDINLEVEKAEFLCLVGPSGCGKSTILKLIAGLEPPTAGTIEKPESVGMVFQSGALLPWLTVEENVAFPIYAKEGSKEKAEDITNKYIQMVALNAFKLKYPRELSGGQKQRVGIARALASEAEVLLLDEPFSALDSVTTNELHKDLLRIWQETGKTIVMVSHLIEEAILLADRIAIMQQGKLKNIVDVSLRRPRREEDRKFPELLEKIKHELSS